MLLGRRIERIPALLVVTYRDDELEDGHPLRATVAALPRAVVRAVPVPPLSRRCVAEQAVHGRRDPGRLFELTGGNPLLVTELLAADGPEVPATVRDLMLTRLRRLSAAGRDVAQLVAVMPAGADAVALAGLGGPVDECLAAGVLRAGNEGVAYRHELLRRAVDDSLTPTRRIALHRRALALLGAVDGIDQARLMHHARGAADTAAVLRHGVPAARAAAAHGAHREAVAHFRVLRPYLGRLPAGTRAGVLEQYAAEAYFAGAAEEGLPVRQAALAERERLGEPGPIGENLRWISRLNWWSGHGGQARAAAARAVDVLTTGTPGRELALAYSNRSQLHMLAHELPDAIEWGKRAMDLADRLGDLETSVHAAVNVHAARLLQDDWTAIGALQRTHTEAATAGLVEPAARALVCIAASLIQGWRVDAAAAEVDRAMAYAEAHDLDGYRQHLQGLRAEVRFEQCDWDGALADADEALSWPTRTGISVVSALVTRGRILAARGDESALATLDLAARHAHGIEELQRIGPVAAARAEYLLLAGEPTGVADEVGLGLALAVAKHDRRVADVLSYRLWQAGQPVPSPPVSSPPESTVDADGEPSPYRQLMAGDWAAAARTWAAQGCRYARVDALSTGDGDAVAEAFATLTDLGANRRAQLLRARLRQAGVTGVPRGPRPVTVANPAHLTGRQLEILTLLADGHTNADIAARLTLSHRTVEHHISALLAKLGVARRGQAVAAARRLNLLS
jgi:DNA-binding CsgD family transcriptional regulator